MARSLDWSGDALPGGDVRTPPGSPSSSTHPDRRPSRDVYGVVAVSAFVAYVLGHLVTVSRSHIPWFDDTFFASVADSLLRTGPFTLAVSPLWFPRPVFLYGPTYFLLVAGFFAKFGFGVLQYRLTGLIAAFALLAVAFRILRREGYSSSSRFSWSSSSLDGFSMNSSCSMAWRSRCSSSSSDFQYLERGGTLAERVKYHRDTYGFEYLVTALDENSETLSAYRDRDDLLKIGEIEVPIFSRFARYPLWVRGHLIMWGFTMNYGGAIYKRVR